MILDLVFLEYCLKNYGFDIICKKKLTKKDKDFLIFPSKIPIVINFRPDIEKNEVLMSIYNQTSVKS